MALMWLNRNAVILNTTLQLLDIYIYIYIKVKSLDQLIIIEACLFIPPHK